MEIAYTEKVFSDYDLTLVNAFTTWCSPCVNEMPELEKLYQEMKEQGVGVVGMVLDTVSVMTAASDDDATVTESSGFKRKNRCHLPAPAPRLRIPERTDLAVLQSFPESFFVDKDGNIVGDPIHGKQRFRRTGKTRVENQLGSTQRG